MRVERKPMTWMERLYYPAVAQGLWLTTRHFVRNLSLHCLHAVGLRRDTPAMVTIEYPDAVRPLPRGARTRHRLTRREDGSPRCVACMMCATACPAACIFIEACEHPDPAIEKAPLQFDLDLSKCVFCGFCVEACPKDAIRMDTGIYELAWHERQPLVLDIHQLLREDAPLPDTRPKNAFTPRTLER